MPDITNACETEYGLHRARITLASATGSLWQSDTIAGYLLSLLAQAEGAESLDVVKKDCEEGNPPFLVSNGFPAGYLPVPILPPPPVDGTLTKAERVERVRRLQQYKGLRYASEGVFSQLISGTPITKIDLPNPKDDVPSFRGASAEHITWKNTIDRATGTTPAEGGGGLYDFVEIAEKEVDIYFRVRHDYVDTLQRLLDLFAVSGYGKRRSVGYGEIERLDFDEFHGFPMTGEPNGFMSLSNFTPAKTDPTSGFWTTMVKYGKVGEGVATENPFKRPLIMLEAGSCFLDDPVRDFYGRIVTDISPGNERVFQYAFALPVPMRLPDHVVTKLGQPG